MEIYLVHFLWTIVHLNFPIRNRMTLWREQKLENTIEIENKQQKKSNLHAACSWIVATNAVNHILDIPK